MKQFKANNKFSIEWNEYWSHNIEALSKATFGGFLNFEADAGLAEGTSYSVLLSPGVRIGDRIQILAMLLTTDEKMVEGYVLEDYCIGSTDYEKLVVNTFFPPDAGIISFDLARLPEVAGKIELVKRDGRLHLDWDSFEPTGTPVSLVAKSPYNIYS